MKKIEFPLFGENEFMYLNIGRLIDIERMAGKSAGEIIRSQNLDLGLLTIILSVALRHHKMRTPQWYADSSMKASTLKRTFKCPSSSASQVPAF